MLQLMRKGTTVSGKVEHVGQATANSFSLMPSSNSDGNYESISSRSCKISLDSTPSKMLFWYER